MTEIQQEYCDTLIKCYKSAPVKQTDASGSRIRNFCYKIAVSKRFDMFIFTCIILNTVCLALSWYGRPDSVSFVLNLLNYIFTFIYTGEFIIKLIALKKQYFNDGWNNFDFVIVVSAWVGIFLLHIFNIDVGPVTTIVRSFRVSRIFKLIGKLASL